MFFSEIKDGCFAKTMAVLLLLCAVAALSGRAPPPTGSQLQRALDAAVGSGERSFVLPPGEVPLGATVSPKKKLGSVKTVLGICSYSRYCQTSVNLG